ncbi:DNA polymerase III subunit delta' [Thiorhodovibrio frisius]|uniref:DNA polymerase III subunit delta' n=1 Tax=Thiorhodovibrio frisius TaxID=631362 RepID=H8Z3L0_9GAMM|nr:DNA polymerase III subunit delta' [Thiorhodovibrio frisius]EIC19999.1 DNA polymerase III, delta'' subunit [Thiorhodovibrio frisius]WPL20728.1 DNA polymerase III subunit delta' [Thiorhodovibrio frisius]
MSEMASASAPIAGGDFPPWLSGHWQHLWKTYRNARLGHAWLLTGPAGLGKRLFADRLAQALLCEHPGEDGVPCGVCAECHLIKAGHHPDLQRIVPDAESASGEIKVNAIRELVALENLTSHRGHFKVVQIVPAEVMNNAAANSLLKTLEEPTERTLLLLVADDASRLPATIRSRCQQLVCVPPPEREALPWLGAMLQSPPAPPELLLRLARGAPLKALSLGKADYLSMRRQGFQQFLGVAEGREDPLAVAAAWQSQDIPMLLEIVLGWLCDIARLLGDPQAQYLSNPDLQDALQALALRLSREKLHDYLRQLMGARALPQASVNRQLLLESLLIRWALLGRAGAMALRSQ